MNTVVLHLLGAMLFVCLGLLLGATWAIQAVQSRLRRQAEERRRLNEEWVRIRLGRQRGKCPLCAGPLPEREWHFATTIADELARRSASLR